MSIGDRHRFLTGKIQKSFYKSVVIVTSIIGKVFQPQILLCLFTILS